MAMSTRKAVAWTYRGVWFLQSVSGTGVLVLGALLKANLSDAAAAFPSLHSGLSAARWAQAQSWWLLPIFVLASSGLAFWQRHIGSPWLWEAIHLHLDAFQESAFEIGEDAAHHHRVTLFRHVGWRWPWGRWPANGWLVPVARSGHTTQNSTSIFRAPDNADDAEGVAGMTWAKRRVVMIKDLPDLLNSTDVRRFEIYARNTGSVPTQVQNSPPHGRSFCGIPVEVRGKLWGVLILDSRNVDGIREDASNLYRPMGRVLGKLLERV